MFNFIVGGYLPGTNIQLSFQADMSLMVLVTAVGMIAFKEYRLIRAKNVPALPLRSILNASQLHLRV